MYEEHLYKKQLMNTMGRSDELVDTVKLHLREKIINKLKSNKAPDQIQTDPSLIKKLCCSLFLDYLSANQYFHSLAVFAPESGSSRSQFTNEQLNSMFRISTAGHDSILEAVLNQVMPKGRLHEKQVESSCQTDDRQCIQNLENKLSHIEFQYKQKMAMGLKNVEDTQQRFLKYKNDLNKRCKAELDAEIDRIRTYQIANIKLQEQERYKIKIKEYQEELQISYKNKVEKLRERQADVMQRISQKMKEIQTYNYQARQKILKDMQEIRHKEEQLNKLKQILNQRQQKMSKSLK